MVVAEVPMWVVHSSVAPTTQQPTDASPKSEDHKQEERANESLALLEGLGGTQKCAIYSIDIHPNGHKFATGGGDGTVRIWNAGALFRASKRKSSRYAKGGAFESSGESSAGEESSTGRTSGEEKSSTSSSSEEEMVHDLSSLVRRKKGGGTVTSPTKPSTPSKPKTLTTKSGTSHHRLLCTLSAHTGSSVLAVRFSTNGQYLASAGDDAVVCIYAPSKASGNLDHQHHVEHWTRVKLCRGHALDAVGLAWAPDDSHLVSCSLDSNTPIIVWKVTDLAQGQKPTHSNVLCNPYKILGKGLHTSTVKGVTFDPAGSYLASSGDDPSVCVWRAHDDWGLEQRIDAASGIFRRWKENDSTSLSSQSLFRRLSWSTDGAYICSTNAVVKNKHVASTISREGWAVSSAKSTASGAANLVGHKQPVVACRHCPFLLDARPPDATNDDEEPEYATLLALGDKRGFVTVWSTKRSRPIFKIQCSETRCTVTDLAWGKVQNDMMLIVSLLDGQVVALRFGVPDELGNVLKPDEQARVFQLRYGIDLNDVSGVGGRRLFVGENSGPKFIENALQYTLEDQGDDEEPDAAGGDASSDEDGPSQAKKMSSAELKANQLETRAKGGKKRIQPFLMAGDRSPKKTKLANGNNQEADKGAKKKVDNLEDAMQLAENAATGAEAAASQKPTNQGRSESVGETSTTGHREISSHPPQNQQAYLLAGAQTATPQIPHSTDRIHSVELPVGDSGALALEVGAKYTADCTNSLQIPQGSSGSALPCSVLSISHAGKHMWKDQLPGTSCTAISASKNLLAVGTSDGCVQLYGTSPSLGWTSGVAFRSHPPFVLGRPIVALQLHDIPATAGETTSTTEMLVVAADGTFGVYRVAPELKVRFKGTIMPPMMHMLLSSDMSTEIHLPKLARIQQTETNRLLLLLSLHSVQGTTANDESRGRGNTAPSVGAGGSLQAFVYSEMSELWMRVADSRFVLSDFYSTLPTTSKAKKAAGGELSKLDDSVRMGAISSTLKTSRRGRAYIGGQANAAYGQTRDGAGNDVATRAHCEDRIACALALGSAAEFEYWLSLYVKTLVMSGNESLLRMLVDLLSGSSNRGGGMDEDGSERSLCWWLSEAPKVLILDRTKLIKSIVIPEMSKNRALQRITNEIAVEVDSLS